MKRTTATAIGLVMLVAGVLAANACLSGEKQSFAIAWSYDTSGYLETCGCSSHQLGGLGRRATKLEALRKQQPVLAIEGPHIVEDKGEFQLFKGEMIVDALDMMQYSALVLGVREAQQGAAGIAKLKADAKFPLVCANLDVGGKPWPVAYVITDIAGTKVGITGASDPKLADFELPKDVSFRDPGPALADALKGMAGAELKVVCLEGGADWVNDMATRFAGQADLFLSGDRKVGTASLDYKAGPPRLNSYDRGRYLGLVTVDHAAGKFSFSGQNLPLGDELADAAPVKKLLDETYKPQLKERFFKTFKDTLPKLFLPADYCADCHKKEVDSYVASHHAKALATLDAKGQTYNPDCMKCHETYDSAEDKLYSMNCVTCHTNITEDHVYQAVQDPKSVIKPKVPVTAYNYAWCVKCHDPLNSSGFKDHWPQYVNVIYHGGDKSAAVAAAKELGIDMSQAPPKHE